MAEETQSTAGPSRQSNKYKVLLALAWGLTLLIAFMAVREPARKQAVSDRQLMEDAFLGMRIYATNCVVCHGPSGEGVVGPPLNRPELQGDPREKTDVYDLIYRTVQRGRPGTTVPHWVRVRDNKGNLRWASYTAMPTWGRSDGGPLDEQMVGAVAKFIMLNKWSDGLPDHEGNVLTISDIITKEAPPNLSEEAFKAMPNSQRLNSAQNEQVKTWLKPADQGGKFGCLGCHTIGSYGGKVGPDLTQVGAWGLDADFLYRWIENPAAMGQERAPIYFSNYGGPLQFPPPSEGMAAGAAPPASGPVNPGARAQRTDTATAGIVPQAPDKVTQTVELPPTVMPAIPMTPEERRLVVEYLLGLGVPGPRP